MSAFVQFAAINRFRCPELDPTNQDCIQVVEKKKKGAQLPAAVNRCSSSGVINPPPTRVLVELLFPLDFCRLICVLGDSKFKSLQFVVQVNAVEQRLHKEGLDELGSVAEL